MNNMEENTDMIPELLALTETYLKYEIKGDVIVKNSFEEPDGFLNINFIFDSYFGTYKFNIPEIILKNTDYLLFGKIIEEEDYICKIKILGCFYIIYLKNNYIYFEQIYAHNIINEFKILKNIALPVIEKLTTIIKNLQG